MRLVFVWGVLLAGAMGLVWRLYQLQVVQASELKNEQSSNKLLALDPIFPDARLLTVR